MSYKENRVKKHLAIYWSAYISFICLVMYGISMNQFFNGIIPNSMYVISLISMYIMIPYGILYFFIAIGLHYKKKSVYFQSHIVSSLITFLGGAMIFLMVVNGYFVTV